jgi:hypothetical protein
MASCAAAEICSSGLGFVTTEVEEIWGIDLGSYSLQRYKAESQTAGDHKCASHVINERNVL